MLYVWPRFFMDSVAARVIEAMSAPSPLDRSS